MNHVERFCYSCHKCNMQFESCEAIERHLQTPAHAKQELADIERGIEARNVEIKAMKTRRTELQKRLKKKSKR